MPEREYPESVALQALDIGENRESEVFKNLEAIKPSQVRKFRDEDKENKQVSDEKVMLKVLI